VALAYHVDVASVRRSLLDDLGPSVTAPLLSPYAGPLERKATALGQAFGVAVGTLLGTTVAELVASPEGILQLLGGVPLRPRGWVWKIAGVRLPMGP
jgi:hypothetical protein